MARTPALAFGLVACLALPAGAQGTSKQKADAVVPASAMPPAGMCRVWLADVPERQQPASTDCPAAIRNRPRGARILFGDQRSEASEPRQPPVTAAPVRVGRRDEPAIRALVAPSPQRAGKAPPPPVPPGPDTGAKPVKPEKPQ